MNSTFDPYKIPVQILRFVCLVISPLIVGGAVYLFLRPQPPQALIFLSDCCRQYFGLILVDQKILFLDKNWNWLIYNLSDGLWAFSLVSFVLLSTQNNNTKVKQCYLFLCILMMLMLETTIGTFDWFDLLAMTIGSCLSLATIKMIFKRNEM